MGNCVRDLVSKENMKLYECKNNTTVKVIGSISIPVASKEIRKGDVIQFKHIDGMYSFCIDKDGDVVHLVAWAEVEPI